MGKSTAADLPAMLHNLNLHRPPPSPHSTAQSKQQCRAAPPHPLFLRRPSPPPSPILPPCPLRGDLVAATAALSLGTLGSVSLAMDNGPLDPDGSLDPGRHLGNQRICFTMQVEIAELHYDQPDAND